MTYHRQSGCPRTDCSASRVCQNTVNCQGMRAKQERRHGYVQVRRSRVYAALWWTFFAIVIVLISFLVWRSCVDREECRQLGGHYDSYERKCFEGREIQTP